MDLWMMYKYAYWGVIERLKTLTKLRGICLEVSDGDAAEEYEIEIEKTKSDFDCIISALGLNCEETYELLNWEIERAVNYEGK